MSTHVPQLRGQCLESGAHDADAHEWARSFSSGVFLRVSAPWRLLSEGCIVIGYDDHGPRFGSSSPVDPPERLSHLSGSGIARVATRARLGDPELYIENGTILQVFTHSMRHAGRVLYVPGDRYLVGLAGGGVSDSVSGC